ncbi:hypothetical protein ACFL0W_03965 [Nanoarchaeota archaeon]
MEFKDFIIWFFVILIVVLAIIFVTSPETIGHGAAYIVKGFHMIFG